MTTTMASNGKLRKSLADQIDRLDGILDGLAEALNGAVAGAVKEAVALAVREGVQAVLTELLTNPAVLEVLRGTAPAAAAPAAPAAVPVPSGAGVGERCRRAWDGLTAGGRAAGAGCVGLWARTREGLQNLQQPLAVLRRYKRPLLAATGVGVVLGVAAYFAGPWLAALASGVGGFVTTLAVQAWRWLRRTLADYVQVA